jgi:hypothetical protein
MLNWCVILIKPAYVFFYHRGTIMGMNQAIAKDCISTNCRAVVMHASKYIHGLYYTIIKI